MPLNNNINWQINLSRECSFVLYTSNKIIPTITMHPRHAPIGKKHTYNYDKYSHDFVLTQ